MPWNLKAPHTRKDGKKIEFYYVRGRYCGIRLNHSVGTGDEGAAKRILRTWRQQAERGEFIVPGREPEPEDSPATFTRAAIAYMRAGGDGSYLPPIMKKWPTRLLIDVDQVAIDTIASELYPSGTAQTRNRQVYTPISAVLKRAGNKMEILRPVGWQGKKSISWLEPEQAFPAFDAADEIDQEFGLLLRHLLYTGMRIDEALSRPLRALQVDRAYCYLDDSKSGEPRGCHLPDYLVKAYRAMPPRPEAKPIVRNDHGHFVSGSRNLVDAGIPFLERHPDVKLFRFHDGGALRQMLKDVWKVLGLTFPRRQGGFHIFCHTYGTWMHRYGGLDAHGLTDTGRWADPDSAWKYVHTSASSAARLSDRMPTPGMVVSLKREVG